MNGLHVPREDSNERMREQLDVILKAWSGEPFNHTGRFYQYENLEVWPQARAAPASADLGILHAHALELRMGGRTGLQRPHRRLSQRRRTSLASTASIARPGTKPAIPRQMEFRRALSLRSGREQARGARDRAQCWRRYIEATTHTNERVGTDGQRPHRRKPPEGDGRAFGYRHAWSRSCAKSRARPTNASMLLARAQDAMGFTQCDCTFFFGGIRFDQAQRSLRLFANEVMPKLNNREPRLTA